MGRKKQKWFSLQHRWWLILIALIGILVWSRQLHLGGFGWSDGPLYAADEVSPFFGMVEGVFSLLFGSSAPTGRITALFFALSGLFAFYWVGRQLYDHATGLLSAALWATLPSTVLWSGQAALEVPTITMILVCLGCHVRYRTTKSWVWLALTTMGFILAVLTNQWAIFFGLVLVVDLVSVWGPDKAFSTRHVLALGSGLMVVVGSMVFSRQAALDRWLIFGDAGRHLLSYDHWLFYIRALPEIAGWPMIAFAGLGVLISGVTGQTKKLWLPMVWLGILYLFVTLIAYKEPRFFHPAAPPIILMAVAGLSSSLEKTRLKSAGTGILMMLFVFQTIEGCRQAPERYSDTARNRRQSETDDSLNGKLIFFRNTSWIFCPTRTDTDRWV